MNSKRLLPLLATLALAGCSGGKESTRPDDPQDGTTRLSENISLTRQENEKVTEYDLNGDKKPDVWSFSVPAKGEDGREFDRLVRKELDINWDNRVDITRIYDEREQLEREMLDMDFDGKVDQVNFYEKGIVVRKERDLDNNGRPDLWLFYERGKLARKERDISGDGKVDYWEYWEGEQVDRVGEDLDGDGQVDKWTKNPESE